MTSAIAIPDSAVEAAARAMSDDWNPDRDPVLTAMFRDYAMSALTAAAPIIASQATADLRARIEALRDEWQTIADGDDVLDDMDDDYASGDRHGHGRCAAALDALLRGA